jgi:glucose-1-phosphate adenylyltransferase
VLAAEQTPSNTTWFQGTADAVRQSMHHFLSHEFDYALILSGDQLYQMDFNEMLDAHKKNKAEISIATIPVNDKDATSFGILKTNEKGRITSFIEKPSADLLPDWTSEVSDDMKSAGRNYLASMGIYIFNRDLLIELMKNPDTMDFGKEIIPQSIDKHKVISHQYEGYWTDIGNIDSFFEANIGLSDDMPEFDLYSRAKRIYTHARMLPTTKISGTLLDKTVIADGCIINAGKIERSVIGIRSRIDKESTVINTYMMGSDYYETIEVLQDDEIIPMGIGARCFIKNAILDKNCRIGNDVRINGGSHLKDDDNDMYTIKDGIVVVKKGAVIPNGFII